MMQTHNQRSLTDRLTILAMAVCLNAGWLLLAQENRSTPAAAKAAMTEMEVAVASAKAHLLTNSACPVEPASIQQAAVNLSIILNPALVQREARKNAMAIQAGASTEASFFNPSALYLKRMEDPGYRKAYTTAMDSFRRQAQVAAPPIPLTAVSSNQIQAVLNNPAWRRQREESLRAAMPPGQAAPGSPAPGEVD